MDPHKRSATIEVMAGDETVLDGGRFATDADGYRAMLATASRFPERTWAIEGCQGIGRLIANRLISDGESVVDVPPKLSARIRVFATGQGRKTDATDAHSVALIGTRMSGLRPVVKDEDLAVLRLAGRSSPLARRGPHPHGLAATSPALGADSRRGHRRICPPLRPKRCSPRCAHAISRQDPPAGGR
jgi:hypothetical protein